jgi:TRAP-type C4-dicarboxylate transport system permease small subunit
VVGRERDAYAQAQSFRVHAAAMLVGCFGAATALVVAASRSVTTALWAVAPAALLGIVGALAGSAFALRISRRFPMLTIATMVADGAGGSLVGLAIALVGRAFWRDVAIATQFGARWIERSWIAAALFGASIGLAIALLERLRQRQQRLAAQLESQRAAAHVLEQQRLQADLQLLQAQAEPHFLFNMLAQGRALIRRDADAANHMLDQLITYFRSCRLRFARPAYRSNVNWPCERRTLRSCGHVPSIRCSC